MQSQSQYIPVNCWKCKAQNNAAQNSVCRICGCFLTEDAETGIRGRYSDPITENPVFRSFLVSTLMVVLVASGLIYYYRSVSAHADNYAVEAAMIPAEVSLPADSWYRKSLWSHVKRLPSVEQIVQKNNEVSGKSMSPEVAKTIRISGKAWYAAGDCFSQGCMAQRARTQSASAAPEAKSIDESKVPEMSDNWSDKNYSEFGTIEIAAKMPDKVMRKARATITGGAYHQADVVEVYNGLSGSKTTKFLDDAGRMGSNATDVIDEEKAAAIRAELSLLWKRGFNDSTDQQVRGIEKLNDRTVFAVKSKNKDGFWETYYFDSVSGLLLKMDLKDLSVYCENYQLNDRAMIPHTIYYRRIEQGGYHSWIKFEISEWKMGEYIDDSVFAG